MGAVRPPPESGAGKPLKAGRVYIDSGLGESLPPPKSREPRGLSYQGKPTGQHFEGVPPEVWNFHIGGFHVCEKWLKDRGGRTLTYEDLEPYRKVVTALSETMRLMAEIDAAIPKWPIE